MRAIATTQIGVIAQVKDCAAITSVLYPRLKTEQAPVFTTIADGHGVKIQHTAGTDYVFVSSVPMKYNDGDITFDGTVGTVLLRGQRTVLTLSAAGSITAHGHTLTDDKAHSQEWKER